MKKYREAKKILFHSASETCKRELPVALELIPHKQAIVLNTEDDFFEEFDEILCAHKFRYGFKKGEIRAEKVHLAKSESTFELHREAEVEKVHLKLPGEFNVENAMAATGTALACEVNLPDIRKALNSFKAVAGRMESIKSSKGFEVIVDFALTPDALERLYKTIRKTATHRVIGIIGSCGDRDKEKRPVMGEIVARHSDICIVTDEEPYSENPMTIMKAVLKGAQKVKNLDEDLFLIKDRYKAIEYAVSHARRGDIIVITGMGSLPTRSLNSGAIEWDEREVVREIISKIDS